MTTFGQTQPVNINQASAGLTFNPTTPNLQNLTASTVVGPTAPKTTTPSPTPSGPIYSGDPTNPFGTGSPFVSSTDASTTTISNANKINQVPGIVNTTNNLAQTGISTDANGNATYSNGEIYSPPAAPTPPPQSQTNPATTSTGGYFGDVYYAPGATVPLDANGSPVALTATSPTDDTILSNLNAAKAQADSLTASLITSIQSQYTQLIQQQTQTNQGQEASENNALLMGGVTGQGSSSQYAPISSNGIIQAQVSYGIQQIADLQNKENQAIIAAQQAGQDADFKIMDSINAQISSIRDEKVVAATKLNDTIATQNQKLADARLQATKDTSVANLYASGVTDPSEILKTLNNSGLTISADEVATAIKNLTPADQAQIQSLAAQAAATGADPDTVEKIAGSSTFNDALTLATPALGADHADKLKQEAITNEQNAERIALEQENVNISLSKLQQDNTAASQAALNAVVTTPSGKKYVNGEGLSDAAKSAAISSGAVVLVGNNAEAMTQIANVQGQLGGLVTSLQSVGVIDQNGNFTGKGFSTGYLLNGKDSVQNFNKNITGTVSNLEKLPGTGDLVATLQNNTLTGKENQKELQSKITVITNALDNAENLFLVNGSSPQEGQTGTINGQNVVFQNGQWVTQ